MRTLRSAIACLLALGLLSCGEEPPEEPAFAAPPFHSRGIRVAVPEGWTATREPTTTLLDPRPLFTASTYEIDPAKPRSCTPVEALKQMPPDGALVIVSRYGRGHGRLRDVPRRPGSFSLSAKNRGRYDCTGPSYALHYREGGRGYGVNVWLDPQAAAPRTRREAEELLNSMELRATE
jgi:hypothetical protein